PYYLDLKERAKFANDNQGVAWQLLSLLAQFITIMTTLIGLGIVLWMFDYWLVIALGVILILNIVIFSLSNKYQIAVTNHMIPINRKFGYYLNTLLSGENAKDYRFSKMNDLLHHKTSKFTHESVSWIKKIFIAMGVFSWFTDIVNYILMGFTYIYIAIKTLAGTVIISDFIFYTGTVLNVSQQLVRLVNIVADLKRNSEWIKPFLELL